MRRVLKKVMPLLFGKILVCRPAESQSGVEFLYGCSRIILFVLRSFFLVFSGGIRPSFASWVVGTVCWIRGFGFGNDMPGDWWAELAWGCREGFDFGVGWVSFWNAFVYIRILDFSLGAIRKFRKSSPKNLEGRTVLRRDKWRFCNQIYTWFECKFMFIDSFIIHYILK